MSVPDEETRSGGQPIRVAHLIHTVAYGGIETALLNWIEEFDKREFEVELLCFSNPGHTELPFVDAAERRNLTVHTIPWHRGKPVLQGAWQLSQFLRKHRIQILHCHNTYANIVGLLAARLAGARAVTTLYVWGDFGRVRNALQRIDRWLLPYFSQVTAHCQETFQRTVDLGFPADRLQLLPCGFKAERCVMEGEDRRVGRKALGAGENNTVLIHVARFYPEKAHDLLLHAFQSVLESRPQARLWLLGVGPLLEQTQALCRELGLESTVTFLGFQPELSRFLALADIQVHPSDDEGVPLAICEGMSQGLPIVATRVGGLAEVIRDERSGLLVSRRDGAECSRALIRLIDDAELRGRLGREASRFIREEYSLEAAVQRVQNVYRQVLQRHPRHRGSSDGAAC